MEPFHLNRLPAELRAKVMKEASLDGWLGRNAVCSLDILGIASSQPGPLRANTYHMTDNGFLDILNKNGIYKVSKEGKRGARDALREAQPLYVLLYTTDHHIPMPSARPTPLSIPRSILALPGALTPSEAFIDILSHPFNSASDFMRVIAGIFGNRVKHIYLMNSHHRFTTTGLVQCTDTPTNREYAFRPSNDAARDPTSLVLGAATLFRWSDGPFQYERHRDTRIETTTKGTLTPDDSRVVTSQATGLECAEVWRQGRQGGEKRLAALEHQPFSMHAEIWTLRRVCVDLLHKSQESGSDLPELESISLMTISRPIRVPKKAPWKRSSWLA